MERAGGWLRHALRLRLSDGAGCHGCRSRQNPHHAVPGFHQLNGDLPDQRQLAACHAQRHSLTTMRETVQAAHALNLSVFLAPILDPSWDIPTNGRSDVPPAGATPVSRLGIGTTFSEAQWTAWFASYARYSRATGTGRGRRDV